MTKTIQLPKFESVKLLVYGDVMLDRYWYGTTSRISPEAPVPVVLVDNMEARPGGAANVALNTVALGVKTKLFGLIGEDAEGDILQEMLHDRNVDCFFQRFPDYPTITKLRVLGCHQQLIRMDFEKKFGKIDDLDLVQQYQQQLEGVNAVILSDYAKGSLGHIKKLIAFAKNKNIPILVDPKADDFSKYSGATLVTPNQKEFEAVVGPCSSVEVIEKKGVDLLKVLDIGALLVTLGKDGMLLLQRDGSPLYLSTQAYEVYDITGAGDTVIAVLAAALASGESLEQATQLANIAAGIVVGKLGAATTNVIELAQAMRFQHPFAQSLLTEASLDIAISNARARGERIVMTNGCFDILHAGHVQYLKEAKLLGERLIVAVNDDESVTRLKGIKRPLNSLQDRMEVLASLRVVDWVIPFSEDTPERLIDRIRPDVLVKGGDYAVNHIAGGRAVLARGGKVRTLGLLPGRSTTHLVEKIKQSFIDDEIKI